MLRAAATGPVPVPGPAVAGVSTGVTQLAMVAEVDLTRVVALAGRAGLPLIAFCARAVLQALSLHPRLNARIGTDGSAVTAQASQHLGIAVSAPAGLVVPVVRDAGDLNLAGLARHLAEATGRALTGRVDSAESASGTFTLADGSGLGVLFHIPLLRPRQAGMLSVGTVAERPVIVRSDGGGFAIAARSLAYFALSYDHRSVSEAQAAAFLGEVKGRLEGAGAAGAG